MNNLLVTASPHFNDNTTTRRLMLDVIIALVPALIAGCVIFGLRALLIVVVTISACVLGEYVSRRIMKRSNTISDLSAVITGMLLGLNLPVTIPLWMAALGGLIAIIIVKQFFGGIGQNFVNPAITARIVLLVSFPAAMSTWVSPFFYRVSGIADAATSASPLANSAAEEGLPTLLNMFLGVRQGCIGETCAAALLLGGIYLVIKKVLSPVIPVAFIGSTILITTIAGEHPLYQLFSGGLLLGAIFMATDYTTSPITFKGRILFGIGCGVITAVIRMFTPLPEGVSYAILFMNILVPHLETLTIPKPFGWKEAR